MVCLMGAHTFRPLSTSQGVSEFHFDGFLSLVWPLQAYVGLLKNRWSTQNRCFQPTNEINGLAIFSVYFICGLIISHSVTLIDDIVSIYAKYGGGIFFGCIQFSFVFWVQWIFYRNTIVCSIFVKIFFFFKNPKCGPGFGVLAIHNRPIMAIFWHSLPDIF